MIQMILVFLIVFLLFFIVIKTYFQLSGKERWVLIKLFAYSAICAILTCLFLVFIVIMF
jgi:hypothetical protein